MMVVVVDHATGGHHSVTHFLRGYVSGLVSKVGTAEEFVDEKT